MDVKSFQLSGGLEIIAKLLRTEDDFYIISLPLQVIAQHAEHNGKAGAQLGLTTWLPFVAKHSEIPLRKAAVMFGPSEPIFDLINLYTQATSGIQLVPGAMVGSQLIRG